MEENTTFQPRVAWCAVCVNQGSSCPTSSTEAASWAGPAAARAPWARPCMLQPPFTVSGLHLGVCSSGNFSHCDPGAHCVQCSAGHATSAVFPDLTHCWPGASSWAASEVTVCPTGLGAAGLLAGCPCMCESAHMNKSGKPVGLTEMAAQDLKVPAP